VFIRKLVILVGLVFAVVVLNPASVAAQPGISAAVPVSPLPHPESIERSVNATVSGTAYLTEVSPFVYTLHTEFGGVVTHGGRYTGTSDANAYFEYPPGIIVGSGTATLVSANGDELYGNQTFYTSSLLGEPPTHTSWVTTDIAGGTGHYEGASGELLTEFLATTKETIGSVKISTLDGTTTGHITTPLN
jgi:hypothetical protein